MPFLPNPSKLVIYQDLSYARRVDVALLTRMVRTRWRRRPSADDLNPPLGGGLTTVLIRLLEGGTLLKAQIAIALGPFSRQGLIIGVDVEPKGYQCDSDVDW